MVVTCEQVSNGHPDKICDQIADAIVTDCLQHDKNSRVAVEALIKNNNLVLAGELTSTWEPDYVSVIDGVFGRIGVDKLDYSGGVQFMNLIDRQSGDIAMGVDLGGAGDQGMMYGYATNETKEMLPIPYVLATQFLKKLRSCGNDMFKADAKSQVSYDYDQGRITTFLCSVQHKEDAKYEDIRHVVSGLMKETAEEYGFNDDFSVLVNPTGRFVIGGSFADCGVTGRKLACDTYGGVGRIGGGALSGKDPTKVDRSGAYIARRIAKDIVRTGVCDRCEVQIAYAIGVAEPVSCFVETYGRSKVSQEELEGMVRSLDLTPRGIINGLGLLDVDYNKVSSYGHFFGDMPWEL